jgi:UDP-N-acetylmuramoyl-L-alanyl-D-glutamate--2,6-diaminopimelate ligase
VKITTANTTPESSILQSILKDMADKGMQAAVIEVSSQALKLYRTLGIRFDERGVVI